MRKTLLSLLLLLMTWNVWAQTNHLVASHLMSSLPRTVNNYKKIDSPVTLLAPTLSGFRATSSTVCAGGVASFTATVDNVTNVTGTYAYTLTNGTISVNGNSSNIGYLGNEPFSQTLIVSGSGVQSFSLVVRADGAEVRANTSLTVGPHPDYQPLVDLYNSTNGAGWLNNSGWLTSCNPCNRTSNTEISGSSWYGVVCSGGRVTRLNLNNNGLIGSLPSSLGSLTNLEYLNINSYNTSMFPVPGRVNQLNGSIPASLGSLTKLQQLYLTGSQLSGSIPESLGALSNLTQLALYENKLSGNIPASLGSLTNLQILLLNNNQLSGNIPATLGSLTKLQNLSLGMNQLNGSIPTSLGALRNLSQLSLADNQLSGCYPTSLTALCSIPSKGFSGNSGLPGGGSSVVFSAFCSNGQGSDTYMPTATAIPSTLPVGGMTLLSAVGGSSYNWIAPAGAVLTSSASNSVVSASLTSVGVQTFTVVVAQGGTCSQAAIVSVTATGVSPTDPGNTPPTVMGPALTAIVGQSFSYSVPSNTFDDDQTPNQLVLNVSGLPAGLFFTAPAAISGIPSVSGISKIRVTATDPGGLSVSMSFRLTVLAEAAVPTPNRFTITGVNTIRCETVDVARGERRVTFTPQYAGLTGLPVSFSVVNELPSTTSVGPYTIRLYNDNPVITLVAKQAEITSTFAYNWLMACGTSQGRTASEETLKVEILGNPLVNDELILEVQGAGGHPLEIRVFDESGKPVCKPILRSSAQVMERVQARVNGPGGTYLLHVSVPGQKQTLKVIKL